MTEAVATHDWQDVADDVAAAIERAIEPLLKRSADAIYDSLLEASQDYLANNMVFNIAGTIETERRSASQARQLSAMYKVQIGKFQELASRAIHTVATAERETTWGDPAVGPTPSEALWVEYHALLADRAQAHAA